MKRAIYAAVCCLALAGSLLAQDIDQRVATLEARGMYDEALALCLREADVTPAAHYFIGDYYYHGRKGVMRDEGKGKAHYLKALKGLRPLAGQGDAVAQYRVARCLEFGKKDLGAARAWYGRAAEGGSAKAMCRCVVLAMKDNPYGEPPAYLERAIELGEPDAMAWRGVMLVEGKETRTEGVALLREAAERGSNIALARLASLHFTGEAGVGQDMGMAVKLLQEAVDKGFSEGIAPLDMVRDEYERRVTARPGEHRAGQPVHAMRPGNGYPGRLAPYAVTPQLDDHLQRYTLTAGWYQREPLETEKWYRRDAGLLLTNELPYLLFTPKSDAAAVPMVIYFGGTGEHGTNLVAQFNHSTIFAKITSPEFQQKYPCYLFAPMVPKKTYLRCDNGVRPPMADLVCDAMYAVIGHAQTPAVDTNRIYLTGLSYGGSAAYTFPFGYPGRFAASLPCAGFATSDAVPPERPGNFWLLHNEHEFASAKMQKVLSDIIGAVTERGGEHRVSTIPDKGHNVWDKAWGEDVVWEWVFSKTADGGAVEPVAANVGGKRQWAALDGAICTASIPGRNRGSEPWRAADHLEATCYVSAKPFQCDDWWQIEFARPVVGTIAVKSGYANGRNRLADAVVVTSADGEQWFLYGEFASDSGICRFAQDTPIKYLRVVSDSQKDQIAVLREIELFDLVTHGSDAN